MKNGTIILSINKTLVDKSLLTKIMLKYNRKFLKMEWRLIMINPNLNIRLFEFKIKKNYF
jgi:hypothetical protein